VRPVLLENDQPIGECHRIEELVGDDARAIELRQLGTKLRRSSVRVPTSSARGEFVEEEGQARLGHERGQGHALLLPTGE
jgi:hypothetical protein